MNSPLIALLTPLLIKGGNKFKLSHYTEKITITAGDTGTINIEPKSKIHHFVYAITYSQMRKTDGTLVHHNGNISFEHYIDGEKSNIPKHTHYGYQSVSELQRTEYLASFITKNNSMKFDFTNAESYDLDFDLTYWFIEIKEGDLKAFKDYMDKIFKLIIQR